MVKLIHASRQQAMQAVNTELIDLYRSLSPALVAEYQTQLPDKKLLAAKLHEFYALNVSGLDDETEI